MPLGVREVLLVIRARDQASRALLDVGSSIHGLGQSGEDVGRSLTTLGSGVLAVGVGIGAVGAAGLAFFNDARDAAVKYNQESALTLTQVDQVGVKLDDIKRIGRDVASAIPAPFEQMQKSLYDIFSSMDVNTKQAQTMLEAFSKGAVAGQVDVQEAGRATIAILNGFKIPVEDVNKVMDVQFELVKKGVGTYDEFASSIGRAIPSAEKAGASVEDLAGMLAFLTRNGQSTALAATAAARSFDLLSNPVFAKNMKEFGINVGDANGNFRPMVDVVTELKDKLSGMNEEARSEALKQLTFGAGGTIQAMRFLNLAVTDSNNLLPELTDAMKNAGGAMEGAYNTMLTQPQTQMQLLTNRWQVLKTEIGDAVIPMFNKLIDVGNKILGWFNSLSPATQAAIEKWAIYGAIIMTVGGFIIAAGGALLILVGTLTTLVGSVGVAIAIVGALVAAIVLIPLAIYAAIQGGADFGKMFTDLKNTASSVASGITEAWTKLQASGQTVWSHISDNVGEFSTSMSDKATKLGQNLAGFWSKSGIAEAASGLWNNIAKDTEPLLGKTTEAVGHVLNVIMEVLRAFAAVFMWVWQNIGTDLLRIVNAALQAVIEVFKGVVKVISGVINLVLDLINGDWGKAWDDLVQIVSGAWDIVFGIVRGAAKIVGDALKAVYNVILEAFKGAGEWLLHAGEDIIGGLLRGIGNKIKDLKDALGSVTNLIPSWKGPPEADAKLLYGSGALIMNGLISGITSQKNSLRMTLQDVTDMISLRSGSVNASTIINGGSLGGSPGGGGGSPIIISPGAFPITIQGNADQSVVDQMQSALVDVLQTVVDRGRQS